MESKQQLYSSLQRQLDGLQQDLQTKQAQIDQQQRLAAAAKQAEERHGQLYHTYMKRALVNLYGHGRLAVVKIAVHPVCTSIGRVARVPIDECAAVRCHADACNCSLSG